MADKSEQGTGKHPHKDSEEPYPHTKEQGKQQGRQSGKQSEMRAESSERGRQQSGEHERQSGTAKGAGSREHEKDLKEREYRDKEGNIHHHTHTSSEMKERKAG